MSRPCLVVFSQVRWDFVYHRPQQLLSRLAARWRVVYVEAPVHDEGPARLMVHSPAPGVTVIVPHTPVAADGFHDEQLATLEPMLARWLTRHGARRAVVWLYTPMALPLVKTLEPLALVYDCLDEATTLPDAPRQFHQRETALLKRADLVLAGGPSLYDALRGRHPNVHCVPGAVDAPHFAPPGPRADAGLVRRAKALQGALQGAQAGPRLGFFGVVDRRIDLRLVDAIALAHPEWQLVMVGPVVGIEPDALPQRPNLHWLGLQPYELLPHLLAGWDLCLMPFAVNETTRCISPTKTLEYMAGEKPVVSTPLPDVQLLFGQAVSVAPAGPDFIAACEAVLDETPAQRCERALEMLTTVSVYSWDRSAASVDALIGAALQRHAAAIGPRAANEPVEASDRSAARSALG